MKTKIVNMMLCIASLICFAACSKESNNQREGTPELNKTNLSLYVGDTFQLIYKSNNCNWSSDNPLIATVEDGLVTAEHVGTTAIHVNNSTCKVTINPRYTKYYDPYLEFGANKEEVKSYMLGHKIEQETTDKILYSGNNGIRAYLYSFNNGKLSGSAFVADLSESSYLGKYLYERYILMDKIGQQLVFLNPTQTLGVMLQVVNYGCLVGIFPNNSGTKTQTFDSESFLSEEIFY